jgi:type IV secretory pathway VirB10-like protein
MLRRFALAACAAATLACSEPPAKERQQADDAVAAARAAGAATYAAAELKAAETALAQYEVAVEQREYREALRLAMDARESASSATTRAAENKAAARVEAERLVASVDELITAANARLAPGGGPRLGTQAAERLRSTLKTATSVVQEARSAITAQQFQKAVSVLTPIEASLRTELASAAPGPSRRGR